MSRRRHEVEFGSDSFLDVLANIVGILIILIVTAGTQVGKHPVVPPAALAALTASPPPPPPAKPAPPVRVPRDLGPDEPPADVAKRLADLSTETGLLAAEARLLETQLQSVQGTVRELQLQATQRKAALEESQNSLKQKRTQVSSLTDEVNQARRSLTGILAEFEAAGEAKPNVKELQHKVTPISQTIEGAELHFRLAKNRVAAIPLEALVERMKLSLERQKEWLAKHRRQEGTVGPVSGFSLNYVLELRSLSPLEELRHGQGLVRVVVGRWELVPEPDLETESADEALRRGSRFTRAIEEADPQTSLTFWVYPDSFGLYRKLQAAAHAGGYLVTGRPLPEGAPISASPDGTRSAGQ